MLRYAILSSFFVLLSTFSSNVYGNYNNEDIDSLKIELEKSKLDNERVKILNNIGALLMDEGSEDAQEYIDSAYNIAVNAKLDKGISESLFYRAKDLAYNKNKFDEGISACEEVLKLIDEHQDFDLSGKVHQLMGWIFERQSKYFQAITSYKAALNSYSAIDPSNDASKTGMGNATISVGLIHHRLENYDLALQFYNDSKIIYTQIKDQNGLAYCYNNTGHILEKDSIYTEALLDYKRALILADSVSNLRLKSIILNNIGSINRKQKKYDTAIDFFRQAMAVDVSLNDQLSKINSKIQILEVWFEQDKEIELSSVLNIYKQSIDYKDVRLQENCLELITAIFLKKGNYKEAYKYDIIADSLSESTKTEDAQIKIKGLELNTQIEAVEREKKFAQQQKEEALRSSLKNKSFIQKLLIGSLLFSLLLVSFIYRNYRKAIEMQQTLRVQNETLSKTETALEKKNEDLEKYIDLNIQLEHFAHIASHDMKAPLRTITSYIGLLKKKLAGKLTDADGEYFNTIETGALRLNDLISDLLEYTKVNSQALNISIFSLRDLIGEVFENLSFQIDNYKIEAQNLKSEMMLNADRTMIKQVLQNLIDNAVKFQKDISNAKVEVSNREDDSYYYISVSDRGIGIPDEYIDKIFGKFTQLHPKDAYEGTGLGLAICQEYIKKHKGKIEVKQNTDQGVTFTFSISKELKEA